MDIDKILSSIEKMRNAVDTLSVETSSNNQNLIKTIFSTITKMDKDLDTANKTLESLSKLKSSVETKIKQNYDTLLDLNSKLSSLKQTDDLQQKPQIRKRLTRRSQNK